MSKPIYGIKNKLGKVKLKQKKNSLSPSASPRVTVYFSRPPPESLESNSITCHPLDKSLFVYYIHLDKQKQPE